MMGAWGEGPFESDDAMDAVDALFKDHVERLVRAKTMREARDQYLVARGVIQWALLTRPPLVRLEAMGRALARILKDKRWLDRWEDPEEIRRVITDEWREVRGRLSERLERDRRRTSPERCSECGRLAFDGVPIHAIGCKMTTEGST